MSSAPTPDISFPFAPGDRVILARDPIGWCQPLRGYAEKQRRATVLSVFETYPSTRIRVRVRFDMRRYARDDSGIYAFDPRDLSLAPDEGDAA